MRLDGVTVADFTHLLPGHYATQLLADMGAEILKIERPDGGNAARQMKLSGTTGLLFDVMNHGKKSLAIDLKSDEGAESLYQLVESVDVIVEQFRPGVTKRLGIDYETLCQYNSDLVYCSLTGYGQTGPASGRIGHDLNFVAKAGLLDMTRGHSDEAPVIPGFPIADMASGLFTTTCVLGALLERSLGNGEGRYIDVSMTDVVASLSQPVAMLGLNGETPKAGETALTGQYPCYDIYESKDGGYLAVAALEPPYWKQLCRELEREDLIEFHLSDDPAIRSALREELSATFMAEPLSVWNQRLGPETMTEPVNTVTGMLEDQQLRSRGMILDERVTPPRMGFPAASDPPIDEMISTPPDLGEQTETVLEEYGVDSEIIHEVTGSDGR